MTGPSDSALEKAAMDALEAALEQPTEEQRQWLAARDDLDPDVRALALQLLASDDSGRVALRTGGAGEILQADDPDPPDLPGYRIIRPLGRGGMGVVYLAERDTAEFEHRVAIKVIKQGVLLEPMIERFRRERQILARLNHPHIAHLHDGGETADGQPYIIMEYVQGTTLREWLGEGEPDLEKRLDLFVQIAQAVEFAHQNLVIHRDLTPGNVLVTDQDQAKLIDFGIARPQAEDTEGQVPSRFTGLSLTPGFAAPERSQGAVSTTLSDIFSLGRILAQMIGFAKQPELDAIAARAGAAEPADRFGSASELIEEIRNFRSGLPVTTYQDTNVYRLRKFVAREKVVVGAFAAVMLAILAGFAATAWGYNRAEQSRIQAEQRFDQLRDLAHFQLFELYDELNSVVGNTQARVALAERAQAYLVVLAGDRSADADLQIETANGFLRLARIQGIPAHPNFGEPDLAKENLDRAQQLLDPLATTGNDRARTALALLESYRALLLAHGESLPDEAMESVTLAEDHLDSVSAASRDAEWMQVRRAVRLAALEWGDLQLESDYIAEKAELLRSEIEEWPQSMRGGYEESTDLARATYYRAIVQHNQGTEESLTQALALYQEADESFAAIEEDFPNDPMTLYWRAWNSYYGYAAAASFENDAVTGRLLQQARSSIERLLLIEEADNSLTTFDERLREAQAQFFANQGNFDEGIALMQQVMDLREEKLAANPAHNNMSDVAFGLAIFGTIYRQAGRREDACSVWARSEELMSELAEADALNGFVENLRGGMVRNLELCRRGAPVESFGILAEGGE